MPEKGNDPFWIDLVLNGNPYRTDGPFYNCVDPTDLTEFNMIVKNLPRGDYKFTVYDSTPPPDTLDARASSGFDVVSPPYATLNGLITPPKPNVQMRTWFEFGLTDQYGSMAEAGYVSGQGTFPVEIQLNAADGGGSLEPGRTYHYRVATTDGATTWYGQDATFDVPGIPVAVTTPATGVTL